MPAFKDLTGQKFGRLTVIRRDGQNPYRQTMYVCRCDDGNVIRVRGGDLTHGDTKSCGCLKLRHGEARRSSGRSSDYISWMSMKLRCNDPARHDYPNYGGRGIRVFPRWNTSFANYIADRNAEIGPRPTPLHTIDRIDNDRGYEPGNIRWATQSQQQRNKRPRRLLPLEQLNQSPRAVKEARSRRRNLAKQTLSNANPDPRYTAAIADYVKNLDDERLEKLVNVVRDPKHPINDSRPRNSLERERTQTAVSKTFQQRVNLPAE
jgi:hypothetical protein